MYGVFCWCLTWCVFDYVCFLVFNNFIGFGGMMFYNIVLTIIVLNVIYELVEVVFPIKKMNTTIKSFVLMVMLYALCDYLIAVL